MKLITTIAAFAALAVLAGAQSTGMGHFDSKGIWHAPKQSRPKQPRTSSPKTKSQNPDSANRDIAKALKELEPKPPKQRKPPKGSQPSTEYRPGYHQEYKFFPGHLTKSGNYIEDAWRWVWVKDPVIDFGGSSKRRKGGN